MNRKEEIINAKENILKDEIELESIKEELKVLEENESVKKYLELINKSKSVYDYIQISNKKRNKEALLEHKIINLKELIKKSCPHQMLLATEELNGNQEFYSCKCIECEKTIYASLTNSYIYASENFTTEEIPIIKAKYQELLNNGKATNERIIIMNLNKKNKVKSRK